MPNDKIRCHMIGNAHLDPVWLWSWREGFQENTATFLSALDRSDEFDEFVFTATSAQFFMWIEENEPELFQRIREKVKQGRWVICGGWWVEPDCNVPSGESFARHALYIKRSQEPVCLMMDEPNEENELRLMVVNDLPHTVTVAYELVRLLENGETLLQSGSQDIPADGSLPLGGIKITPGEQAFYLIRWEYQGKQCINHYVSNLLDIDHQWYLSMLRRSGLNKME